MRPIYPRGDQAREQKAGRENGWNAEAGAQQTIWRGILMDVGQYICYWANREVGTGDGGAGASAGQVGVAGSERTGELVQGRGNKQTRKM